MSDAASEEGGVTAMLASLGLAELLETVDVSAPLPLISFPYVSKIGRASFAASAPCARGKRTRTAKLIRDGSNSPLL